MEFAARHTLGYEGHVDPSQFSVVGNNKVDGVAEEGHLQLRRP